MKTNKLSPKQVRAVEIMAEYVDLNEGELCERLGCSHDTLRRWKKNPLFMQELIRLTRVNVKYKLPKIYGKLADRACAGSEKHAKILLDHLEKLEEWNAIASENIVTFTWTCRTPSPPQEEEEIVDETIES